MTSPSIFDLGTVTLTNGSAEVTGDGTAWAVNGVAGGMFSAGGMSVPIASVDDDTTLTLAYPWPGSNAAAVAYAISLLGSQAADTIWASRHWSRIVGQALLAGIHPAASGTLAERDALNPMLEDGQWFAHAEPPYDLTFYRKVPGGWEGPYQFRGEVGGPDEQAMLQFYGTLALEQAEDRETGPVTAGPSGNGLFDGFNTLDYVDVAGATNLDTSELGSLKPPDESVVISAATPPGGKFNLSDVTYVDRSFKLTNGGTVTHIGVYSLTAKTFNLKVVQRVAATSYVVLVSESFAHSGSGWEDHELSSPYAVPASGDFHVSSYYAAGVNEFNGSTLRATFSGDAGLGARTFSESTGNVSGMRATELLPGDMTVDSSALTLSAAPSWVRLYAFVRLDAATVNTNIIFSVARDGSDFQTVVMEPAYTRPGGSTVLQSGKISLTNNIGTTGRWRIQTDNAVRPIVDAVGVIFGAG